MTRSSGNERGPRSPRRPRRRLAVLVLLVLTLGAAVVLGLVVTRDSWAWASSHPEYRFDPRRLDLGRRRPAWMQRQPLAEAFFASYLAVAGPSFSLLDGEALADFERSLRTSPWILAVGLRRELPRRVQLELDLRQPVAMTLDGRGRLWLLADDGWPLPLVPGQPGLAEFERTLGDGLVPGGGLALPDPDAVLVAGPEPYGLPLILGGPALDPRPGLSAQAPGRRHATDAARIVAQFEGELRPFLVAAGLEVPPLYGIDASNAGYRRFLGRAEYRVVLLDPDGHPVYLDWGHGPESPYPCLPWQDKARNLRRLLTDWPGLRGLRQADLRFSQSWREQVVPRDRGGDEAPR